MFSLFELFRAMSHYGSGEPLRRKDKEEIYAWYQHGVRGHGYKATAQRFQRPVDTVRSIVKHGDAFAGDFSPQPKSGRPPTVTEDDIEKMTRMIEEDPYITDTRLAAALEGKVTRFHVGRILSSLEPPIVRVTAVKVEPK